MDLSPPPRTDSILASTSTVVNEVYVVPETNEGAIPLRSRLRNLVRRKTDNTNNTDKAHKMLGEWRATSIAGNDISASCLYTAGICARKGIK